MSDQTAGPQHPAPAAEAVAAPPQQYAPATSAAPEPPATPTTPTTPSYDAQHAWIDGYEPGNPWQSRLVFETEFGTVAYPLTPNTMPELLEGLVMVAQEQQGITGDLDLDTPDGPSGDGRPDSTSIHDGRAARMTGWAVVHDLWEREDPKARFIMGGIVVALLLIGIILA
ncbi:hypothetical protein [Streptomyces sp. NPDC058579]|uniref:hypothetical protein n=1 Tax=Streptomyces sp. NPDC058579 TaxID=3346548 RepID=UPI0036503D85